ncbi:MAG: hypothetical protein RMJ84_09665 [Sandaracinaceae bacterium]|nr:hypothetical protein [Sandaracinaceae bacterium]
MKPSDFESPSCLSPQELAQALEQMWRERRRPELAALASEFARIAGLAHSIEEGEGEVSPFLYVLF